MITEKTFYDWAKKMGCPEDSLPDKETLKWLLVNENSMLQNMITRIRPQKEVANIRTQLTVNRFKKFNEGKGSMPSQLRLHNKIVETRGECSKARNDMEKLDAKYVEKLKQSKATGIKIMQKRNEISNNDAKVCLLQKKLCHLQATLGNEQERNKNFLDAFPPAEDVKLNVNQIIGNSINEVKEFMSKLQQETISQEAQDEIWQSMRNLLNPIPRSVLWKSCMRELESIIKNMDSLGESLKSVQTEGASIDYATTYLKGKEIVSRLQSKMVLMPKVEKLSVKNDDALTLFSNSIDDKFGNTLTDEEKSKYIFAVGHKLIYESQIELLNEKIEKAKQEHFNLQEKINYEGVKAMAEETRDSYSDAEKLVRELESGITKVYRNKKKILAEKEANEAFVKDQFKLNKTIMIANPAGQQSADFVNELNLFDVLPIYKVKRPELLVNDAMDTQLNPYILNSELCADDLLSMPPHYLTIQGIQKYILAKKNFNSQLEALKTAVIPSVKSIKVNESELNSRSANNYERISELLDNITSVNLIAEQHLEKAEIRYQFLYQNPLRKYVPLNRLFNGRTYKEYENEYTLYYRMEINKKESP